VIKSNEPFSSLLKSGAPPSRDAERLRGEDIGLEQISSAA